MQTDQPLDFMIHYLIIGLDGSLFLFSGAVQIPRFANVKLV